MRRFYGVGLEDAFTSIPSDEFWSLTSALVAYDGVVAALVKKQLEKEKADAAGADLDAPELAGVIDVVRVPTQEV